MSKTISVCNKKGGVAKTATAVNLAAALVRENKKVLVIDLDPQHDATKILMPDGVKVEYTVSELLEMSDGVNEADCIYTSDEGIDFIGSSNKLTNTEIRLATEMCRETILKRVLEKIKPDYDYIVIDCPPSTGLVTINALAATDYVVIRLDGLNELMKYISITRSNINADIKVAGILITKYSPVTNIAKVVCKKVDNITTLPVFETRIRLSARVSETPALRKTIFEYKPNDKAAMDYTELAKEVMRRYEYEEAAISNG